MKIVAGIITLLVLLAQGINVVSFSQTYSEEEEKRLVIELLEAKQGLANALVYTLEEEFRLECFSWLREIGDPTEKKLHGYHTKISAKNNELELTWLISPNTDRPFDVNVRYVENFEPEIWSAYLSWDKSWKEVLPNNNPYRTFKRDEVVLSISISKRWITIHKMNNY